MPSRRRTPGAPQELFLKGDCHSFDYPLHFCLVPGVTATVQATTSPRRTSHQDQATDHARDPTSAGGLVLPYHSIAMSSGAIVVDESVEAIVISVVCYDPDGGLYRCLGKRESAHS